MSVEVGSTVYYAFANPATSGDNAVVAAITGASIRVISFLVTNNASTANNVKFRSGTTDISALIDLPGNATPSSVAYAGGVYAPICQTAPGAALNLNLSASTAVGVTVAYQRIG